MSIANATPPGLAGSQSMSGTISGGSAAGGGVSVGNNRNPSGSFQRSRAGAWNNTTAGSSLHSGGDHANVNAEVRSKGGTQSMSRGRSFGQGGSGGTGAFAAQGGTGNAIAVGGVSDRHHNSSGGGILGAGVSGQQGSVAITSNEDTGIARANSRGIFDGEANADLHINADDNDVHVTQSSDIDVLAGGRANTMERGGGNAFAAGGGEVNALSGTLATTNTGSHHIGPQYNIAATLFDGTD